MSVQFFALMKLQRRINKKMSNTIIETKDLCYQSGKRFLIDHINWKVNEGEKWLVFGLNGSGKTTLLSTICGFKSPTSGKVLVFGEEYTENNILYLRSHIGWVSSSFFDKFYNRESALNIVLSGLSGTFGLDYRFINDNDVQFAINLLHELHVERCTNMPFNLLSKGERQHVLIARALITKPKVLILDEPCTGLDIYAQKHMINTIKLLSNNTNLTVIYVTHQPEEIGSFLENTLLLKNGHIFAKGETKTILTSETLSKLLETSVDATWHTNDRLILDIEAPSKIPSIF